MKSHTHDPKYYYFACYSDGARIEKGARFYRATSKPEMLSNMQEYCDTEITGFEEGYFSDCWAKITRAPTEDDFERWSEEYDLPSDTFVVRAPGTHPGGNFWWVDISIPIYVPVIKVEEAMP